MPLLRDNIASLYEQIATVIREEMQSGQYEPSGKLPSETALCERFGVSRVTVRLALDKLCDQGLIERKQGKGSYAAGKQLRHGLDHLRSFHDSLLQQGLQPTMQLLSQEVIATPEPVRKKIPSNEMQCLLLQRLHLVEGEPIAVGRHYLPAEVAAIDWELNQDKPTYTIVEELSGLAVSRADISIKLGKADKGLAMALQVDLGTALLVMERTSFFSNQACSDYSVFYIRPERYEFNLQTIFRQNG